MVAELRAVLFDMDGTIVDTEPYWHIAEFELVESYGGTWSQQHAEYLIGADLMHAAEYIREHGNVPMAPRDIVDWMDNRVLTQVTELTPWRPGARELLAELNAAQVPCALVTMSFAGMAQAVVGQLPAGTFATVVSGDQVSAGKPHPAPYLLAAERLGVAAGECVAIEDSPTGIASAQAAGCVVIAVPHQVPIAPDPRRTVLPTLDGVSLAQLRDIARTAHTRP